MVISSSIHTFFYSESNNYNLDLSYSWIGLVNWIPLFWCFWSCRFYLKNEKNRKNAGIILISGSIPILVTGFGQFFFNWYGPMSTFFGLITWYQRPLNFDLGLSGLFNNANYAGAWLNIIWPFCLSSALKKSSLQRKTIIYSVLLGIFVCTILTNSRSAWISLIISFPIFFGLNALKFIAPFLLSFYLLIAGSISQIFGEKIQYILQTIIPKNIWQEFTGAGFGFLNDPRIQIWKNGISYIKDSPLFGSGANYFSNKYFYINNIWIAHSHNIPLEISISYGLPAAILISIVVFLITIKCFYKVIFLNKYKTNFSEKAWVTSLIILSLSQLIDIQYFDARISIGFWILLAGASNIIDEKQVNKKQKI